MTSPAIRRHQTFDFLALKPPLLLGSRHWCALPWNQRGGITLPSANYPRHVPAGSRQCGNCDWTSFMIQRLSWQGSLRPSL
jgi:hypothetical protein